MSDVLKGNFKPKTAVTTEKGIEAETLENRFEREALKRLGGSMAFVKKHQVLWDEEVRAASHDESAADDDLVTKPE